MSVTDLESLRRKIETIDYQILELVRKRTETAEEVGLYKKENGLPVKNPQIEEKVLERYSQYAESEGLDPERMKKICRLLMEEAVSREEQV